MQLDVLSNKHSINYVLTNTHVNSLLAANWNTTLSDWDNWIIFSDWNKKLNVRKHYSASSKIQFLIFIYPVNLFVRYETISLQCVCLLTTRCIVSSDQIFIDVNVFFIPPETVTCMCANIRTSRMLWSPAVQYTPFSEFKSLLSFYVLSWWKDFKYGCCPWSYLRNWGLYVH